MGQPGAHRALLVQLSLHAQIPAHAQVHQQKSLAHRKAQVLAPAGHRFDFTAHGLTQERSGLHVLQAARPQQFCPLHRATQDRHTSTPAASQGARYRFNFR